MLMTLVLLPGIKALKYELMLTPKEVNEYRT